MERFIFGTLAEPTDMRCYLVQNPLSAHPSAISALNTAAHRFIPVAGIDLAVIDGLLRDQLVDYAGYLAKYPAADALAKLSQGVSHLRLWQQLCADESLSDDSLVLIAEEGVVLNHGWQRILPALALWFKQNPPVAADVLHPSAAQTTQTSQQSRAEADGQANAAAPAQQENSSQPAVLSAGLGVVSLAHPGLINFSAEVDPGLKLGSDLALGAEQETKETKETKQENKQENQHSQTQASAARALTLATGTTQLATSVTRNGFSYAFAKLKLGQQQRVSLPLEAPAQAIACDIGVGEIPPEAWEFDYLGVVQENLQTILDGKLGQGLIDFTKLSQVGLESGPWLVGNLWDDGTSPPEQTPTQDQKNSTPSPQDAPNQGYKLYDPSLHQAVQDLQAQIAAIKQEHAQLVRQSLEAGAGIYPPCYDPISEEFSDPDVEAAYQKSRGASATKKTDLDQDYVAQGDINMMRRERIAPWGSSKYRYRLDQLERLFEQKLLGLLALTERQEPKLVAEFAQDLQQLGLPAEQVQQLVPDYKLLGSELSSELSALETTSPEPSSLQFSAGSKSSRLYFSNLSGASLYLVRVGALRNFCAQYVNVAQVLAGDTLHAQYLQTLKEGLAQDPSELKGDNLAALNRKLYQLRTEPASAHQKKRLADPIDAWHLLEQAMLGPKATTDLTTEKHQQASSQAGSNQAGSNHPSHKTHTPFHATLYPAVGVAITDLYGNLRLSKPQLDKLYLQQSTQSRAASVGQLAIEVKAALAQAGYQVSTGYQKRIELHRDALRSSGYPLPSHSYPYLPLALTQAHLPLLNAQASLYPGKDLDAFLAKGLQRYAYLSRQSLLELAQRVQLVVDGTASQARQVLANLHNYIAETGTPGQPGHALNIYGVGATSQMPQVVEVLVADFSLNEVYYQKSGFNKVDLWSSVQVETLRESLVGLGIANLVDLKKSLVANRDFGRGLVAELAKEGEVGVGDFRAPDPYQFVHYFYNPNYSAQLALLAAQVTDPENFGTVVSGFDLWKGENGTSAETASPETSPETSAETNSSPASSDLAEVSPQQSSFITAGQSLTLTAACQQAQELGLASLEVQALIPALASPTLDFKQLTFLGQHNPNQLGQRWGLAAGLGFSPLASQSAPALNQHYQGSSLIKQAFVITGTSGNHLSLFYAQPNTELFEPVVLDHQAGQERAMRDWRFEFPHWVYGKWEQVKPAQDLAYSQALLKAANNPNLNDQDWILVAQDDVVLDSHWWAKCSHLLPYATWLYPNLNLLYLEAPGVTNFGPNGELLVPLKEYKVDLPQLEAEVRYDNGLRLTEKIFAEQLAQIHQQTQPQTHLQIKQQTHPHIHQQPHSQTQKAHAPDLNNLVIGPRQEVNSTQVTSAPMRFSMVQTTRSPRLGYDAGVNAKVAGVTSVPGKFLTANRLSLNFVPQGFYHHGVNWHSELKELGVEGRFDLAEPVAVRLVGKAEKNPSSQSLHNQLTSASLLTAKGVISSPWLAHELLSHDYLNVVNHDASLTKANQRQVPRVQAQQARFLTSGLDAASYYAAQREINQLLKMAQALQSLRYGYLQNRDLSWAYPNYRFLLRQHQFHLLLQAGIDLTGQLYPRIDLQAHLLRAPARVNGLPYGQAAGLAPLAAEVNQASQDAQDTLDKSQALNAQALRQVQAEKSVRFINFPVLNQNLMQTQPTQATKSSSLTKLLAYTPVLLVVEEVEQVEQVRQVGQVEQVRQVAQAEQVAQVKNPAVATENKPALGLACAETQLTTQAPLASLQPVSALAYGLTSPHLAQPYGIVSFQGLDNHFSARVDQADYQGYQIQPLTHQHLLGSLVTYLTVGYQLLDQYASCQDLVNCFTTCQPVEPQAQALVNQRVDFLATCLYHQHEQALRAFGLSQPGVQELPKLSRQHELKKQQQAYANQAERQAELERLRKLYTQATGAAQFVDAGAIAGTEETAGTGETAGVAETADVAQATGDNAINQAQATKAPSAKGQATKSSDRLAAQNQRLRDLFTELQVSYLLREDKQEQERQSLELNKALPSRAWLDFVASLDSWQELLQRRRWVASRFSLENLELIELTDRVEQPNQTKLAQHAQDVQAAPAASSLQQLGKLIANKVNASPFQLPKWAKKQQLAPSYPGLMAVRVGAIRAQAAYIASPDFRALDLKLERQSISHAEQHLKAQADLLAQVRQDQATKAQTSSTPTSSTQTSPTQTASAKLQAQALTLINTVKPHQPAAVTKLQANPLLAIRDGYLQAGAQPAGLTYSAYRAGAQVTNYFSQAVSRMGAPVSRLGYGFASKASYELHQLYPAQAKFVSLEFVKAYLESLLQQKVSKPLQATLALQDEFASEQTSSPRLSADGLTADGANGLVADGLAAEGLAAEGLTADGLSADGLSADGLTAENLSTVDVTKLVRLLQAHQAGKLPVNLQKLALHYQLRQQGQTGREIINEPAPVSHPTTGLVRPSTPLVDALPKFLINLPSQPERLAFMLKQDLGDFTLVEAVWGKGLTEEQKQARFDLERAKYYGNLDPNPGEIGCTLSHCKIYLEVLADASIGEDDWVLISEDDSTFAPDWRVRLEEVLHYLYTQKHSLNLVLCAHIFLENKFLDAEEFLATNYVYSDLSQRLVLNDKLELYGMTGYYPHGSSCYLVRKGALRRHVRKIARPFWVADNFPYCVDFAEGTYAYLNPPLSSQNLSLPSTIVAERNQRTEQHRSERRKQPLWAEPIDYLDGSKYVLQRQLSLEQLQKKFPGFHVIKRPNLAQLRATLSAKGYPNLLAEYFDIDAFTKTYGKAPTEQEILDGVQQKLLLQQLATKCAAIQFCLVVDDDLEVDSRLYAYAPYTDKEFTPAQAAKLKQEVADLLAQAEADLAKVEIELAAAQQAAENPAEQADSGASAQESTLEQAADASDTLAKLQRQRDLCQVRVAKLKAKLEANLELTAAYLTAKANLALKYIDTRVGLSMTICHLTHGYLENPLATYTKDYLTDLGVKPRNFWPINPHEFMWSTNFVQFGAGSKCYICIPLHLLNTNAHTKPVSWRVDDWTQVCKLGDNHVWYLNPAIVLKQGQDWKPYSEHSLLTRDAEVNPPEM